jgi:hypothetical protein
MYEKELIMKQRKKWRPILLLLLVALTLFLLLRRRVKLTTHDDGSGHILEVGKKTVVYFNNDWKQVFQIGKCNWYAFTLAYMYFEIDELSKHYELVCILLGVGFTLRYDRDFAHSLIKRLADEAYEEIEHKRLMKEVKVSD